MKVPYFSGFCLAVCMAWGRPAWAGEPRDTSSGFQAGEYREELRKGNALYGKGSKLAWTGAALLPLSLLALIPVMHDGAFGITAADPSIGGFIGAAGLGLIHIGIPIMGRGADRLEAGAKGAQPGFQPSRASGWSLYRQSWTLMALGGGLLVAAFPFVVVAALDWTTDDAPVDYLALGLAYSGLGLGAAGMLEQEYCWYRFNRRRHDAKAALGSLSLSLRPVLRLARDGEPAAGLALRAGF